MRNFVTWFGLMAWCSMALAQNPALTNPAKAVEKAPDNFRVKFETTAGDFQVDVVRDWSPHGVDRFYNLVKIGYFEDVAFYRVMKGFMAQFGFHGDPAVNKAWSSAFIVDDPVKMSNTTGRLVFANMGRPNSRSTQFFINYGENRNLDNMGFAPFGEVVGDGMDVVRALYGDYGECAPRGRGPHQGYLSQQGNAYLKENFPKLDYIKNVVLIEE